MAGPIRKDLKSSPQKEAIPAPQLADTKATSEGAALDVFSAASAATSGAIAAASRAQTAGLAEPQVSLSSDPASTETSERGEASQVAASTDLRSASDAAPKGIEAVHQAGDARLEPVLSRDFTQQDRAPETKEPDSELLRLIQDREDVFNRITENVVGRELGIGEGTDTPEASRDSGRDALEAQVTEAIPQGETETSGDRRGRQGTPEDLGVTSGFGPKDELASGGAGMDLFNVALPNAGVSGARDDLAIMLGMVPGGRGSAGATPSVANEDTIPDAPPVDDTAADPLLDQPANLLPQAPPPPALGGRSLVFGGAAGNQNFTTGEAADAAGDVGSAIAKLIPGPVGQVANSFFVGWRAGRAIDNATGIGEKAVNAALPHTEAGKFEAEMTRRAAEAEAAARARDSQNASSGGASPAPHVSRPSEFGSPEPTPEYMAWRAAGRARLGLGQGGSGDIDPTDEGNEGVPAVGPGASPALHLAVGMSEDATQNFLLGQPVEDAVRGGGSIDFGNLPGDRGNIDYGPDSTGAWTGNTRTESEADALGTYRPSLGISDANSQSQEDEEDTDDAT